MYGAHSLRHGFATTAAAYGVEERNIMRQTRHHSVNMVRRYINEANKFVDNPISIPAMNTCILVNVVCLAINSRPTHTDKTKITKEPKLEISLDNVELPNRPPKIAMRIKTIVYTQVHNNTS